MTAPRRLEPTGNYGGSIWGAIPNPYPVEQAQRVYRFLLDQIPGDAPARMLMGNGFTGVAYRFRAASEYSREFETLFNESGGAAPGVEGVYRQERALFGFFVSGLACLESFAFALHAIGGYYKPNKFGLSSAQLRGVTPSSVAEKLANNWPSSLVAEQMSRLVNDDMFEVWNYIRNVLSHRVVVPRAIYVDVGGPERPRVAWRLYDHHGGRDEPLELITAPRRQWLEERISELWNGVEQSFPPP